jgi:inner membrane transporter RhtA
VGLVAAGAVSVQFGAALATRLFHQVGPAGAATWRLVVAAAVLLAATGGRAPRRRSDLLVAAAFGLVLAAMNVSFYEAIARIPLGVAVTLEFSGPLALALVGSRRWSDAVWAAAAGAGVALLASSGGSHLDPAGIGLALLAGCFWIGYILLSRETGRRFAAPGRRDGFTAPSRRGRFARRQQPQWIDGLALAMTSGGIAILPWGLYSGGAAMFDPSVAGVGAAVAVLSSVVPYSLEMAALRRVNPRTFGVMLSLDPAVATAAGFAVLGQQLSGREWAALALVVAANLGNSLYGRVQPVAGAP